MTVRRIADTGRRGRLAAYAFALALAGCQAEPDEGDGGIIGTGMELRGTVPTGRTLARAELEVRAASGERAAAPVGPDGRYALERLPGTGPWLLRVGLGNGEAYHAVAHAHVTGGAVRNVHAYSDFAVRSWFATRGRSPEAAFDAAGETALPDAAGLGAIDARIDALIAGSLAAYGLAGADLDTVAFVANDTGVDRFLDRNPVLVADGRVTLVVTDPVDATQAFPVEALPLETDLAAPDLAAPSPPTALRALPSTEDEIVLAWEGASDDIGVAGYEIVRDGAVLDRTPYPVYLDASLAPGAVHAYAVVAIDASGNRSAPSAVASASPLAAPDAEPPPPPVNLRLVPGLDSVSLEWGQAEIGDVAAFEIERGPSPARLEPLARVTATFALDAGLNSATEYCYRVRASDASGNASAPTPVACATTLGTRVTTAPGAAPAPGFAGAASLEAVDVAGLACTETVPTLLVRDRLALSGPCLRVPSTLAVGAGGRLVLGAGTALKFASGAGIRVDEGGALEALGTADAPVVLSGVNPTPGAWNGVALRSGAGPLNRLEHTVIEYAGAAAAAALATDARAGRPVRLAADNLVLRRGAGPGFAFGRDTALERFSRVLSTDNASSGSLGPVAAGTLGPGSGFAGNAEDGVRLLSGRAAGPVALAGLDVPWLLGRLDLESSLAIGAGARLRVDAGGAITVLQTGSLAALGTADAPIVLEGSEPVPGHWTGLVFRLSGSTDNRLEHVRVAHAGAAGAETGAALATETRAGLPVRLALADVALVESDGAGFRLGADTVLGRFERVTSSANASSGALFPSALAGVGDGIALVGNLRDELELGRQTLDRPLTIPALGVPYRFAGLRTRAALAIAPGVTLRARAGAVLGVDRPGSLFAVGTAARPIALVGEVAAPGHWNGVELVESDAPANRLEFATVAHGGGGSGAGPANLVLRCAAGRPARVSLANAALVDGAGWGVYRTDPDLCAATIGAGTRIEGNALGPLGPEGP